MQMLLCRLAAHMDICLSRTVCARNGKYATPKISIEHDLLLGIGFFKRQDYHPFGPV
jgi:hypothetical protein